MFGIELHFPVSSYCPSVEIQFSTSSATVWAPHVFAPSNDFLVQVMTVVSQISQLVVELSVECSDSWVFRQPINGWRLRDETTGVALGIWRLPSIHGHGIWGPQRWDPVFSVTRILPSKEFIRLHFSYIREAGCCEALEQERCSVETAVASFASAEPTSKNPTFLLPPYSFGVTCLAKSFGLL